MPLKVEYEGIVVGEYFADLIIEERVIIELKASRDIDDAHVAQCLNYLKATGLQVCLLLNFGTSHLGIKRLIL